MHAWNIAMSKLELAQRVRRAEEGQALVEYATLLAFLVVAMVAVAAAAPGFASAISGTISAAAAAI
jgi:Flp pilus assembly pilin Flp